MATKQMNAWVERRISSPAGRVYEYIADFANHHPHILPSAFSDFRVEQGGFGAGTVHSFKMTVGGRSRLYQMTVDEPEPGRVLTESDTKSAAVTTFTVSPEADECRVRIETQWEGAGGLEGFLERLFAPRMLRSIFSDELERLERYAANQE